jgi:hypothetical protein
MHVLSDLAALAPVGDQRRELELWFEAALTHPEEDYDGYSDRAAAFNLRNALLRVLDLAYFLERLGPEEK